MLTLEQKNLEEYMCSQMVMNHRLFSILSKKYIRLSIGYLRFLRIDQMFFYVVRMLLAN